MLLYFQTIETILQGFRDLAKVSVYLEQMRFDDITYESSSMLNHYDNLQEQGVYWLLCELHKLATSLNRDITSDVIEEVESVEVTDIKTRSQRHMRDYIVLRDFDKILYSVIIKFGILADFHRTPTLL